MAPNPGRPSCESAVCEWMSKTRASGSSAARRGIGRGRNAAQAMKPLIDRTNSAHTAASRAPRIAGEAVGAPPAPRPNSRASANSNTAQTMKPTMSCRLPPFSQSASSVNGAK